jgi:phosphoglycolate phosphatase-like HAD superfamily hydrolase
LFDVDGTLIDSNVWDVHAARSAGAPAAAVLSGGTSREALEQAGAVAIYDGPLDVHEHIEGFGQLVGS